MPLVNTPAKASSTVLRSDGCRGRAVSRYVPFNSRYSNSSPPGRMV